MTSTAVMVQTEVLEHSDRPPTCGCFAPLRSPLSRKPLGSAETRTAYAMRHSSPGNRSNTNERR
jgi:hypothetical protein